ncbi:helix-hairpin-helix domain-containing protein [Ureibacillus acetophenoni]|uniref:Competence protein ComEA n=1 Tax=Ureibacillus acetophenoni TaxID=614649 RepID=A0A285U336_9BACL|nr:helix-hairpin-helix domain-containing protein [Ureibacillus acetophenoni]SOC36354.1 competence protein ComEA [Ureibacillus acetophenoni]
MCYSPGILCIVILFIFLQQNHSSEEQLEPLTLIPIETEQSNLDEPSLVIEEQEFQQNVIVDIKGAVKYPGVYELSSEKRIIDVIELAGGYTEDANSKNINHAQKLQDEMVIYVPRIDEEMEEEQFKSIVTSPETKSSSNLVNINMANESELSTLPGIGPSKAQAIIAYRQEQGNFQTVEDLKNVTGIGDKTFEKLKEFITVK